MIAQEYKHPLVIVAPTNKDLYTWEAVSYTHLDVYKRQVRCTIISFKKVST